MVEQASAFCDWCRQTGVAVCRGREFYLHKERKFLCRKMKNEILLRSNAKYPGSKYPGLVFFERDFLKLTPDELTPEMLALLEVFET